MALNIRRFIKGKFKLKVMKQINSPYGKFAVPGDVIEYENGIVTFDNSSMTFPNFMNYCVGITIVDKFKIILLRYKRI